MKNYALLCIVNERKCLLSGADFPNRLTLEFLYNTMASCGA